MHLIRYADAVPVSPAQSRGGPLADTVHSQYRGVLERREEKRTGGVREMMPAEKHLIVFYAQNFLYLPPEMEFFLKPERHGLPEDPGGAGNGIDRRGKYALELQYRLVVKNYVVKVPRFYSGAAKAEIYCVNGKSVI